MSYAASKQFVSPQGATGEHGTGTALPWELDGGQAAARADSWLLSFIDILALLLTLFVLLLAYQDRDFEQLRAGNRIEAGAESLLPLPAWLTHYETPLTVPVPGREQTGYAAPGDNLVPRALDILPVAEPQTTVEPAADGPVGDVPGVQTQTAVAPSVDEATQERSGETGTGASTAPGPDPVDELMAALDAGPLGERVEVVAGKADVRLEISDNILFAPASAALSGSGDRLIGELAVLLRTLPYAVSVEGHTDNVPIRTARYPSNWELSSARAAAVTRALIGEGIAPSRLRAVGYGETRPRAGNDTGTGRARNRRVSFVLRAEGGR